MCHIVPCYACGWTAASNVSRQKKHLEGCENYYSGQCKSGVSNETTRIFKEDNSTKVQSRPGGLQQTPITTISKPKPAANLDYLIAQAIYSRARPFTLFEPEDVEIPIEAIKKAPRSRNAPSRHKISGDLLKDVVESVQGQVDKHVKQART
ncbi:hypothetical protein E4U14_000950 [Claviceps sp. LM454 group G7]|nr:hypothetical protein E4U14_000950 [Claviceps sp. LM454 group G7]